MILLIIDGNVIKDLLGVQIDSKLKFHNHTTAVIKKANRVTDELYYSIFICIVNTFL